MGRPTAKLGSRAFQALLEWKATEWAALCKELLCACDSPRAGIDIKLTFSSEYLLEPFPELGDAITPYSNQEYVVMFRSAQEFLVSSSNPGGIGASWSELGILSSSC